MQGYIHSIETLGTVDGPGIRYVLFLQGCPMRCKYCHNPDTWDINSGKLMSTDEILDDYEKYRSFLKHGGLTVTGGEPLLQVDFLIELFEKAKKRDIHTCIDTSGITYQQDNISYLQKLNQLMNYTDLVLLDIKHINSKEHESLTGFSNEPVLAFAKYLDSKKIPVWIRHVVVPTLTFNESYLNDLGYFLGDFKNIKALDVLPYHDLGIMKYQQLGMDYPLKGIPTLDKEDAIKAREWIINGIKKKIREKKLSSK